MRSCSTLVPPELESLAPYGPALEMVRLRVDEGTARVITPTGARMDVRVVDTEEWEPDTAAVVALGAQVRANSDATPVLLALPRIPPGLARTLRALDQPYIDRAGNCHIDLGGTYIHVEGRRSRAGQGRPRESSSTPGGETVFTAAGARVIFVLLVRRELRVAPVREIAGAARVAAGSAHRILAGLRADGFLVQGGESIGRAPELLRLWAMAYGQRLRPTLQTRWVETALPRDEAADRITAVGRSTVLCHGRGTGLRGDDSMVVFAQPPWSEVVRAGRLRTMTEETGLTLVAQFWDEELVEVGAEAPASLAAAELMLHMDPRVREAGSAMLSAAADDV